MNQRLFITPRPVLPNAKPTVTQPAQARPIPPEQSFARVLEQAVAHPLKLSGHARERLAASGRTLLETEMQSLAVAVDKVARKGGRDALILMPDMALVVSVRNRTVITAVESGRMRENIFTNIDSAVIL
jgi:flagellar operon protein